ncbi:4-alpha-glucanotransferase [Candidatus Sumerlaeota bacterium]|nr:4-alpha-glucanotransferase [Candidatus Sumerlaeota bacterium]
MSQRYNRRAGILLHPTSLPGRFGIGCLGSQAFHFVDFLQAAGQSLWQICPLGPTGFGDSPYQCFSAFAGNPLLIDPSNLHQMKLLKNKQLDSTPDFPTGRVDYGPVIEWKHGILREAYDAYCAKPAPGLADEFALFKRENAGWLDDFTLFMALKDAHSGAPWPRWERELVQRDPEALKNARGKFKHNIERSAFCQFLFFRQWMTLKRYANEREIQIIGDLPIFVAHDSADVWANQDIFKLDDAGNPAVMAGVPPDYFSKTGQLWGNPLYDWDKLAARKFDWWIERCSTLLKLVDIVRVDHFRGFEACWEVPAGEETAVVGRWVKTPGEALFTALREALGELPVIAEDLGLITQEVDALREQFRFPGMKVLQFAFGGKPHHGYLPHNYEPNCVVYTGTHDNDTALGWYLSTNEKTREAARRYLWVDGSNIAWDLIHAALISVAETAIIPMQDVLGLGNDARMNIPGQAGGNWTWRMFPGQANERLAATLFEQTMLSNRIPRLAREYDEDDAFDEAELREKLKE